MEMFGLFLKVAVMTMVFIVVVCVILSIQRSRTVTHRSRTAINTDAVTNPDTATDSEYLRPQPRDQVDVTKIPRIIHQMYKTTTIPPHWQPSPEAWKRYHPDYQYIFWTDAKLRAFISDYAPWFLPTYDNYSEPIQRADVSRYFLLYFYGGIYADLDMEPLQSFEGLLRTFDDQEGTQVYLSETPNGFKSGSITNALMISKPYAEFWLTVQSHLAKPYFSERPNRFTWRTFGNFYRYGQILGSTGPGYLNDMKTYYEQTQRNGTVIHIPHELTHPSTIYDTKPCTKNGAMIRELSGSSWHVNTREEDTGPKLGMYLYRNMSAILGATAVCFAGSTWYYRHRLQVLAKKYGDLQS